jgi:hypothetical protein
LTGFFFPFCDATTKKKRRRRRRGKRRSEVAGKAGKGSGRFSIYDER